jgi:hypothetical protein
MQRATRLDFANLPAVVQVDNVFPEAIKRRGQ